MGLVMRMFIDRLEWLGVGLLFVVCVMACVLPPIVVVLGVLGWLFNLI